MKPKQLITGALTTCLLMLFCFLQLKAQRLNLPAPSNLQIDSVSSVFIWSSPINNKAHLPQLLGFRVFLDGADTAFTEDTAYTFPYLTYGQSYTAGVCAMYSMGNSDTVELDFISGWLPPPNSVVAENVENYGYVEWEHPLNDSLQEPENLLNYAFYVNDEFVRNVDKDSLSVYYVTQSFQDYCFGVAAVYDLGMYGLPDETAESQVVWSDTLFIGLIWNLPFTEEWDYGNFEANMWEHECTDNWIVDLESGSPAPSAMFSGSNALQDYDCDLTTVVLFGTEIVDGDIRLAFDLKLEDISSDSTEFFKVYVDYTDSAKLIKSIANQGSFGWQAYDIKITEYAKGYDFRITFKASGENTSNIDAWFLDNIRVYQDCLPPNNFTLDYWDVPTPNVKLDWHPPGYCFHDYLFKHDDSFENGFASTSGGHGLGQVFYPESPCFPCYIIKVKYFVTYFQNYSAEVEIYILTADGDSVLSGPYYHSGAEPDSWVEIETDSLEVNEDGFMIATFNTAAGGPYIGVDDSYYDASLYFGSIGSMIELSELGPCCYVGSHMAMVSCPDQSNGPRELLGYDVYKQLANNGFEKLNEELLVETIFYDTWYGFDDAFYFVKSVYDQCEASSDTLPLYVMDANEVTLKNKSWQLFPNPASHHFTIESTEKIEGIRILSLQAELIRSIENINQNTFEADVSGLPNGLYVVSVRTSSVITNRKIIIHK